MAWRVFQGGFMVGCALALYGQYDGAMGIKTMGDIAGGGLIFGVLFDAIYAVHVLRRCLSATVQ
jgi:hypothetical protein